MELRIEYEYWGIELVVYILHCGIDKHFIRSISSVVEY